jgi:dynein light intermediate chain 1
MAGTAAAGIVGPLGSSSFNLPTVERALTEMEVGIGGSPVGGGDTGRRVNRTSGRPAGVATLGTSTSSSAATRGPTSPSALSATTPSPTGGQTQHEVLQNFFQSLLSSKDRAGAGGTTAKPTLPKANGTGSADEGS